MTTPQRRRYRRRLWAGNIILFLGFGWWEYTHDHTYIESALLALLLGVCYIAWIFCDQLIYDYDHEKNDLGMHLSDEEQLERLTLLKRDEQEKDVSHVPPQPSDFDEITVSCMVRDLNSKAEEPFSKDSRIEELRQWFFDRDLEDLRWAYQIRPDLFSEQTNQEINDIKLKFKQRSKETLA